MFIIVNMKQSSIFSGAVALIAISLIMATKSDSVLNRHNTISLVKSFCKNQWGFSDPFVSQQNETLTCVSRRPINFVLNPYFQKPLEQSTQSWKTVNRRKDCGSSGNIYISTISFKGITKNLNGLVKCVHTTPHKIVERQANVDESTSTTNVPARKPKLRAFLKCKEVHRIPRLTIVCSTDEHNDVVMHDLQDNNLCTSNLCDYDTYIAAGVECPKTIFVCSVTDSISGLKNSRQFSPDECLNFINSSAPCLRKVLKRSSHKKDVPNSTVSISVHGLMVFLVFIFANKIVPTKL